ncbi:MAG TPA: TldD/PmbA family protein [Thermohalobaculum sp.]|nr:TldD/PmbA family protein [Thermohalobaculum sp.]
MERHDPDGHDLDGYDRDGHDLELAEALIDAARRAGAEAADVLVVSATSLGVGVRGGRLEEAERSEGRDLGLRVLMGRRQACVSGSDIRRAALGEMAERAVAMARAAPEDPWCGLAGLDEPGTPADPAALELADPQHPPAPQALEELALAAEAAALAVAGVTQVDQASAGWGRDRITLMATNGFQGSYARTSASIGVSAMAGQGPGRESDHAYEARSFRADLPDAAWVGERAGRRAVERLGARKPPSGRFAVLFDERVAGSLIGHVLAAINGLAIVRGASWLRDAMGAQVLPAGFEVADDPLIRRGPASRPFDGEGLAARRNALIADGVLRSWVLDLATARKLGLASTASARRGTGGPPQPGTSNIRVTQGDVGRDALIARMGTGLVVTGLIGASINPTTGAYSRGASGLWVEGGEIAHPVNEITIAGSLPEIVRTLIPADDADPHRAVSVPSLLVEGLTVGA